jgi:hypothetical protein
MAILGQDFFKFTGDTYKIKVSVENATKDLSSYQAYWAIANSPGTSPVLVKTTAGDFSEEGGIAWTSTDMMEISISELDTLLLTSSVYYHELVIKDPVTGKSNVISVGDLDLKRSLFRSVWKFDFDYQAVLDFATAQGYTLPSLSQQILQNNLLIALKLSNIWNKLHIFRIYATDGDRDFALINWKKPGTFNGNRVNNPTFITNQGYEGNGTDATINTVDYLLQLEQTFNNWGLGTWVYRETTAGDAIMGSSQNNALYRASSHANIFGSSRIQQSNLGEQNIPAVSSLGTGFRSIWRTGNTEGYMMRDGDATLVSFGQSTEVDTGFLRELYRFNVFSNAIHSGVWVGEPVVTEHSDFYTAINNYMTSI